MDHKVILIGSGLSDFAIHRHMAERGIEVIVVDLEHVSARSNIHAQEPIEYKKRLELTELPKMEYPRTLEDLKRLDKNNYITGKKLPRKKNKRR